MSGQISWVLSARVSEIDNPNCMGAESFSLQQQSYVLLLRLYSYRMKIGIKMTCSVFQVGRKNLIIKMIVTHVLKKKNQNISAVLFSILFDLTICLNPVVTILEKLVALKMSPFFAWPWKVGSDFFLSSFLFFFHLFIKKAFYH